MKHNAKKTLALLLALVMVLSLVPAMGTAAYADGESYTLTIPSTLTVANSGWNATDGISATGTPESGMKLTVTASSDDEFALVSGENKVSYKLATTSTDTEATTSWEFDSLSDTATTKTMGIIVEDYSEKPAGTYQDTVTFTAKVEDAAPPATPLDNTTTAWSAGTFAVPAGGLTYSDAITVTGDATLVLSDGETLTLNKGISLASGATLTVQGTGTMNVNGTSNSSASTVAGTGTLVLTSGTLTAKGGNGGSYGNREATSGSKPAGGVAINGAVTVSGGTLTATGGAGGSIGDRNANVTAGAGGAAISGSVTVNSGTLTATGGNGGNGGDHSTGTAGAGGAAIGGDLTVNDGMMTATNGSNGVVTTSPSAVTLGAGGKAVAGTVTDNR